MTPAGRALHDRFVAAIDDDLDMPVALALLREILRADLADDERRWLVLDADLVLGLDLDRVWERRRRPARPQAVPPEIASLVEARAVARTARDWARADALRAEVEALGWDVVDGPAGPVLTRRRPGRRRVALRRLPDQEVEARPEAIDDPVEVALALAVALAVGEARLPAVVMANRPAVRRVLRRVADVALALVAQDQAPPDVEVPIEPEVLVERPAFGDVGPPERLHVALDRIDVAGRRVLELPEVVRNDPPPARDGDGRSSSAAASGVTTSPVGSTLVSSRTTTGPVVMRSPMFVAVAWPRRSLVQTISAGRSAGDLSLERLEHLGLLG